MTTPLIAFAAVSLTQLFIFADAAVFRLYGFHFNGFVWNIVSTPGGIESLGAGRSTYVTVSLLVIGSLLAELLLLRACFSLGRIRSLGRLILGRRRIAWLVAGILLLGGTERIAYGISDLRAYRPVLVASTAFPFYARTRLWSIGERFGWRKPREEWSEMPADMTNLSYPKAEPKIPKDSKKYNVVLLVAESLRWDMLDPEIMPETWAFAQRSVQFTRHYSAGNGTRMGIFGMFYGLYGPYWFRFQQEMRSPVFVDALLDARYDFDVFTSARFSFPEFNKTVWRKLPGNRMHEGDPNLQGWQNDRKYVSEIIDSIGKHRSEDGPFFRFMFYESAHARYTFPKESIIRPDYKKDFDYATMDVKRDAELIKNRYANACHHLDSQFGRMFDYLESSGLLESTIVIVTGDHGEEFMDNGRWGHHTAFNDAQIRVPMIISVPGREPRTYDRLTSHLDLAPTILALLGDRTPPAEYSLGHDMFGEQPRDHVVVSDWDRLAWIDDRVRIVIPVTRNNFTGREVYDSNYTRLSDAAAAAAVKEHSADLVDVLNGLRRFSR